MPRNMTKLGQHFLVDDYSIETIVRHVLQDIKGPLLEIGPGLGALTVPVTNRGHTVTAIELDSTLIPRLQKKVRDPAALTIIQADALQFDFASLPGTSWRIFGNLPYQISALLMIKLGAHRDKIDAMVFMVQKEVADRLAALPNTSAYGRLSVMVQAWCRIDVVLAVPPRCFQPPPQVDSSVFVATPSPRASTAGLDWSLFTRVVARAFRHKRKMCYRSFSDYIEASVWQALGLSSSARPSEISVEQYIQLTHRLQQLPAEQLTAI